jgi:hypothetical protein
MSTPQKRQINHVVFNPNGTYVYSRPGSNTTFRTPSGHVAAAALERAMLTAGIVRARREAEIKREELQSKTKRRKRRRRQRPRGSSAICSIQSSGWSQD